MHEDQKQSTKWKANCLFQCSCIGNWFYKDSEFQLLSHYPQNTAYPKVIGNFHTLTQPGL